MKKIIFIQALKLMKKMVTYTNRKIANYLTLIACFITYKKEKKRKEQASTIDNVNVRPLALIFSKIPLVHSRIYSLLRTM